MATKLVNNTGLSEFAVKIKESVPQFGESSSGQVSKSLIDLFYPVGSYYETSNTSFNPNTAWGGTWVEDSSGKVTAAYQSSDANFGTVGQTGGEKTHTLTVDEMPSHDHIEKWVGKHNSWGNTYFDIVYGPSHPQEETGYHWGVPLEDIQKTQTSGSYPDFQYKENIALTGYKGKDTAHNNLQPYIVVKRWHRTA